MRAVNLLTYDAVIAAPRLPALPRPSGRLAGGVAAAVLILGLGSLYFTTSQAASQSERELTALKAQEQAVVARTQSPQVQALGEREQRTAAVNAALIHRVSWDRVLRRVARVLPASVSVTRLSMQAPTVPGGALEGAPAANPADGTGAAGFQLSGLTFTQPLVALVLDRLASVRNLVDVRLQSSTKTTILKRPVRQFEIVAGIRPEGAPR